MKLYVGKEEYGNLVFRRALRDSFVLLCSYSTRVHMEKADTESAGNGSKQKACKYLVAQEADGSKGADVESPKRCVKCEQREWDRLFGYRG